MVASSLPLPRLAARTIDSIPLFTDDALYDASSVRIAFTGRAGGASEGDYASLNLFTVRTAHILPHIEAKARFLSAHRAAQRRMRAPRLCKEDSLFLREKLKRCGKSAPARRQRRGLVNPIWSKRK